MTIILTKRNCKTESEKMDHLSAQEGCNDEPDATDTFCEREELRRRHQGVAQAEAASETVGELKKLKPKGLMGS